MKSLNLIGDMRSYVRPQWTYATNLRLPQRTCAVMSDLSGHTLLCQTFDSDPKSVCPCFSDKVLYLVFKSYIVRMAEFYAYFRKKPDENRSHKGNTIH